MDNRRGGAPVQRGSLKQVKDRRRARVWRAQWRENGKGRTRILGRCIDLGRGEAQAELDRIVAAVNGLEAAARGGTQTLREFTEGEYLVHMSGVWRASTAEWTENLIQLHILSRLGNRQLIDITRKDLQALLHEKAAAGYSFSVVAHIRWQLRAIFRMAKGDALIVTEPAESLNVPVKKSTRNKRVIGPEEILKGQLALEMRERHKSATN